MTNKKSDKKFWIRLVCLIMAFMLVSGLLYALVEGALG